MRAVELLSPAGSFDAACAAFHFGADAVYLGLSRLSARAEAVNFTGDELNSITAYAHGLPRRRAVYVAVNTLVRDDELNDVLDELECAANAGADGLIVQDLAVASLVRSHFPGLPLHASTQMGLHSLEGAIAARDLGFSRVVLARELTLAEIQEIAAKSGVETEVFIHGALCYGYSGFCLFSALATGRSGNRGRCAYCCREPFVSEDGTHTAFPFSMRDLCLANDVLRLRDAGVASLKIEGRMKSPIYVAAATRLYRLILDGKATGAEIADAAADLQTVFSRPTTRLYLNGRSGDPAGLVDAETVGHRGTPIGKVEEVRVLRGRHVLRLTTSRTLERHDGLQVDLPGRPFGFPVDDIRRVGSPRPEISCPAGTRVEVALPPDAPTLPKGARVFCSASQAVRRALSFPRPRAADTRAAAPVDIAVSLRADGLAAKSTIGGQPVSAEIAAQLPQANHPETTRAAVEKAFARMGDSHWRAQSLAVDDPDARYAPASLLNELRRRLCEALDETSSRIREARHARTCAAIAALKPLPRDHGVPDGISVKTPLSSPPGHIDANEVVLALTIDDCLAGSAAESVSVWRSANRHVRVALPQIVRADDTAAVEDTIQALLSAGVRDWEVADLAGLHAIRRLARGEASLTADGSLYAFNAIAARELRALGVGAAVIPFEADDAQIAALCEREPDFFIPVERARPPLFISETRPAANWARGKAFTLQDRRGNRYDVGQQDGRWLTRQANPLHPSVPPTATRRRRDLTDQP